MSTTSVDKKLGIFNAKQSLDPGCFFENLSYKGLLSDFKDDEEGNGYPSEILFELSTIASEGRDHLSSMKGSFVGKQPNNKETTSWQSSFKDRMNPRQIEFSERSLFESGASLDFCSFTNQKGDSDDFADLPVKETRSQSYPVQIKKKKVIKLKGYLDGLYSNPEEDRVMKSLMHLYNMLK